MKLAGSFGQSVPSSSQASNLNQTYNRNDRISEIDLPDGSKYLMTYHAHGDLTQITLPTGGVIQYDYNLGTSTWPGNLINVTDANNHTTTFSYNDNFPDGNRNTYTFVTILSRSATP